jgi:hypothetical protein
MEAIRERVSQLSLAGARVDLTEGSVDAQRSGINGEHKCFHFSLLMPYWTSLCVLRRAC